MQGFFQAVVSAYLDEPKATDVFRSGRGLPWCDHSPCLFCGTERFFRPIYAANLIDQWIPALEGVREKLERGAKVADVGCGHGSSTIIMAQKYPNSTFHGFDFHEPSIEHARDRARSAGQPEDHHARRPRGRTRADRAPTTRETMTTIVSTTRVAK